MDHLIIDVVVGLLLIYIAASFLLVKVQESLHGAFYRGRVSNLLAVMDEAVGRDESLKKLVLGNSLISSLWSGPGDPRTGGLLTRANGPSKVPGDLFAKALLMSLNPSGNMPSTEGRTPLEFIDDLMKVARPESDRYRYLQALRALVPGNASSWSAFELAIATWFGDIGDRAEGWFKRTSEQIGLGLALLLCLAINIDTCHIVNALGSDTELRQGFGALGELVVQQNGGAAPKPAPLPAEVALDPAVRSIARLRDAQRYVVEATRKDRAIAAYGAYESDTGTVCPAGLSRDEAIAASAPLGVTSTVTLEVRPTKEGQVVKEVRDTRVAAAEPGASRPGRYAEGRYLSNSDTWVLVLTRLQPVLQASVQRLDAGSPNDEQLRDVYRCLSHVGAWVNSAIVVSNTTDSRNAMLEAAKAIEDSAASVLAVLRNAEALGGLRDLFRLDPVAFERCVARPQSMPALTACVLKEQNLMSRLPIGHAATNWRQQFCKVVTADAAGNASSQAPSGGICAGQVPAQPQLGLPALKLEWDAGSTLTAVGGFLLSALFISLGAPVLFGLLEKFVGLKNAGRVRDATRSGVQGAGTLPLPMLAMNDGGDARSAAPTASIATLPGVEGAQPGFEEGLSPREIQAVKQRLDVQPSSGGFDAATRAALLKEIGSETLTLASFTQLMGRAPVQAGSAVGTLPTTRPILRQPYALAQTLAENLNVKTGFPHRVNPATERSFNDEMRAMAVLYRFRRQNDFTHAAPIFETVNQHPAQLDQIEETLLNEILGTASPATARFPDAPWMDIALGELGQVESNGSTRATSNPRVCDYLDAVGLGDRGDTTPWCGAFVAWVLSHPHATGPGAPPDHVPTNGFQPHAKTGLLLPVQDAALANSWKGWQRPPRTGAGAQPPAVGKGGKPPPSIGDVVVVDVGGGKAHTGFVFELGSAGTGEFWMLGGNQRKGSRVSLSRFALDAIIV